MQLLTLDEREHPICKSSEIRISVLSLIGRLRGDYTWARSRPSEHLSGSVPYSKVSEALTLK
jgi:hypothetical protein